MIEWARFNREALSSHMVYTRGTIGSLIARWWLSAACVAWSSSGIH